MIGIDDHESEMNRDRIESLLNKEVLLRKVIRVAQAESEIDLGVNPSSFSQAKTGYLSEQDFEYIARVCALVEKRLKNPEWILETLDSIESKLIANKNTNRGVRFDDELFKAGRGILESFLDENT